MNILVISTGTKYIASILEVVLAVKSMDTLVLRSSVLREYDILVKSQNHKSYRNFATSGHNFS